jgi:hypothetical protein
MWTLANSMIASLAGSVPLVFNINDADQGKVPSYHNSGMLILHAALPPRSEPTSGHHGLWPTG